MTLEGAPEAVGIDGTGPVFGPTVADPHTAGRVSESASRVASRYAP